MPIAVLIEGGECLRVTQKTLDMIPNVPQTGPRHHAATSPVGRFRRDSIIIGFLGDIARRTASVSLDDAPRPMAVNRNLRLPTHADRASAGQPCVNAGANS